MSAVTCACSFGPDRTGSGPCASYLVQPPSCCLTLWNQEVVSGLLLARELPYPCLSTTLGTFQKASWQLIGQLHVQKGKSICM